MKKIFWLYILCVVYVQGLNAQQVKSDHTEAPKTAEAKKENSKSQDTDTTTTENKAIKKQESTDLATKERDELVEKDENSGADKEILKPTEELSGNIASEQVETFSESPEEEVFEDSKAPVFDDFALAHESLKAIPRVTAIVSDDLSGVKSVIIYVRRIGQSEYAAYPLTAGDGGLFIGQLEQGIQKIGFEYYVAAEDAAGNVNELGNSTHPYRVDPVQIGLLEKIKVEKESLQKKGPPIASYWIAIAYGIGVTGLVAAAVLAYQSLNTMFLIYPDTDFLELREDVTLTDTNLQAHKNGMIISGSIAAILGVVGLSAFSVATGLLIYDAGYE